MHSIWLQSTDFAINDCEHSSECNPDMLEIAEIGTDRQTGKTKLLRHILPDRFSLSTISQYKESREVGGGWRQRKNW